MRGCAGFSRNGCMATCDGVNILGLDIREGPTTTVGAAHLGGYPRVRVAPEKLTHSGRIDVQLPLPVRDAHGLHQLYPVGTRARKSTSAGMRLKIGAGDGRGGGSLLLE